MILLFYQKMANGQFAKLLDDNKLKGPNYADWYRNLMLVLTSEKLDKVVKNPAPERPGDRASEARRRDYQDWEDKNSLARCFVIASLDNSIQRQFDQIELAKDILDSLRTMYEEQNRSTRQKVLKLFMTAQMTKGQKVHDHCLRMMGYINELEALGSGLDLGTQVDAILNSLPSSFNAFTMNYNMNKLNVSVQELSNMLQRAEDLLKKDEPVVMLAEANKSGKRKRKAKKPQKKTTKPKKQKKNKASDVCHFCKQTGHWKRNCPTYLESKKGNIETCVIETNMLVTSVSWCVDSGASTHACNSL